VSSNPVHGEAYSIKHYVVKFVNDLRQVSGFLWVLRFPPPIKIDRHDIAEILLTLESSRLFLFYYGSERMIINVT
jgi:hypothetical protein